MRQPPAARTRILRSVAVLICIIGIAGILVALFEHFGPHRKPSRSHTTRPANKSKPAVPKHLVSLGDSITFGMHLPGSKLATKPGQLGTPAPSSYPLLVAKSNHWHVTDLGIPNDTSSDLLSALQTQTFQRALKQADIVTIDIGSNDLIHAANNIVEEIMQNPSEVSSESESAAFQQALRGFSRNLPAIIRDVRAQTKAPIVLMTLYDPFPDNTALHEITEPLLAEANDTILRQAIAARCAVANTYAVMNHQQNSYILASDVHPSLSGQRHIAQVVQAAIAHPVDFQPEDEAIVEAGTRIRTRPQMFAGTLKTANAGQMFEVIGQTQIWLHVRISSRTTGYVPASSAKLVLRPWPTKANLSYSTKVGAGTLSGPSASASVMAFRWHGTVYAPAAQFAKLAGVQSSWQPSTRTTQLMTPAESGLIANAATNPLGFTAASKTNHMNLQVQGILLTIDGEPVHLAHPVLLAGNAVYLPAMDAWRALGGQATTS